VSWHFLLGQEEASWEGSCLVGAPSALSRLMPTAAACSSLGSETATSNPSRSGMTSARSTAGPGAATSMSSAGASHARTSPAPGRAQVSVAHAAASGLSSLASLAKYDRASRSWRTAQISLLADSTSSSVTWPRSGTMLDGTCWELATSAPRTSETASGSWLPTPTGAGNEESPSMLKWAGHRRLAEMRAPPLPTPLASDHKGASARSGRGKRHGGPRLSPELAQARGYLPTPTATLYGSNQGGAMGRTGPKRPSLEGRTGGVWLALREWLMGWPIGWTACAPLATDRFRQWFDSHGRR